MRDLDQGAKEGATSPQGWPTDGTEDTLTRAPAPLAALPPAFSGTRGRLDGQQEGTAAVEKPIAGAVQDTLEAPASLHELRMAYSAAHSKVDKPEEGFAAAVGWFRGVAAQILLWGQMPEARLKRELPEPARPVTTAEEQPISADAVMRTFEQMCVAMSASGALVALRDSEGVRCVVSFGNAPAVGSRLQPDSSFTKECIETGEVVVCEDTGTDQRIQPSVAKSLNLRSAVAVPIQVQGSVVGLIEVFCSQPFSIYASAVAALRRAANLFAGHIVAKPGEAFLGVSVLPPPQEEKASPGNEQSVERAQLVAESDWVSAVDSPQPIHEEQPTPVAATGAEVIEQVASRGHAEVDSSRPAAVEALGPAVATNSEVVEQVEAHGRAEVDSPPPAPEQAVPPAVATSAQVVEHVVDAAPPISEPDRVATDGPGTRVVEHVRAWRGAQLEGSRWRFARHLLRPRALLAGATCVVLLLLLLFVSFRNKGSQTSTGERARSGVAGTGSAQFRIREKGNSPGSNGAEASRTPVPPSAAPSAAAKTHRLEGKAGEADFFTSRAVPEEDKSTILDRADHGREILAGAPRELKSPNRRSDRRAESARSSVSAPEIGELQPPELPKEATNVDLIGRRLVSSSPIRPGGLSAPDFVLERTFKGHSNWVTAIAFAPSGRLASGSWDKTVKFWDVRTGSELEGLRGRPTHVQAMAFSRDGRWLAAENSIYAVSIWDVSSGEQVRTLATDKSLPAARSNWVYSIAFSPDGRWLASGVDDKTVRIWDASTGMKVRDLTGLRRAVIYVAFSPDGRFLATGNGDETIQIWEVSTGTQTRTLTGHKKTVFAVAFSPNGRWLASASGDRTIKFWEVGTGLEVRTLMGHQNTVTSLAFSPNGRWLASGSWDKTVKIWDVGSGEELQTLDAHAHSIFTVAIDPRGQWLASGSEDGTVGVWRLSEAVNHSELPTNP
jgi:Tol biopolymer transport system component